MKQNTNWDDLIHQYSTLIDKKFTKGLSDTEQLLLDIVTERVDAEMLPYDNNILKIIESKSLENRN